MVSIPFVLLFHTMAYLISVAMDLGVGAFDKDIDETEARSLSVIWSVYSTNVIMFALWMCGSPLCMCFAFATMIGTQNLYTILLFRRTSFDFFTSFFTGGLLSMQVGTPRRWDCELNLRASETEYVDSTYQKRQIHLRKDQVGSSESETGEKRLQKVFSVDSSIFSGVESIANENERSINSQDVYLDYEHLPGTKVWQYTVDECARRFPGNEYTATMHKWVMAHLKGRQLYKGSGKSIEPADPDEVIQQARELFVSLKARQQSGLDEDCTHGKLSEKSVLTKLTQEPSGPEKSQSLGCSVDGSVANTSQSTELITLSDVILFGQTRFASSDTPSISTGEKPTVLQEIHDGVDSSEKRDIESGLRALHSIDDIQSRPSDEQTNTKSRGRKGRSTRNNRKKSEIASKKDDVNIYLGMTYDPGNIEFLSIVKQATKRFDSKDEYSDDIHSWVLSKLSTKSFMLRNSYGTFREAYPLEVRKYAENAFNTDVESRARRSDASDAQIKAHPRASSSENCTSESSAVSSQEPAKWLSWLFEPEFNPNTVLKAGILSKSLWSPQSNQDANTRDEMNTRELGTNEERENASTSHALEGKPRIDHRGRLTRHPLRVEC